MAGQRAAFVMRADLESETEINCPLPDCDYKWCKNCNKPIEGEEKHSCDGTTELRDLMASEGWKVRLPITHTMTHVRMRGVGVPGMQGTY